MKKLFRNPKEGYLGGVCHGLGEYTGSDPILWRVGFLLCLGPLVYVGLWIFTKEN